MTQSLPPSPNHGRSSSTNTNTTAITTTTRTPHLPPELLHQIALHLPSAHDAICFALAYRPFRDLYSPQYWAALPESGRVDAYFLRCRLYRDLPLIYYCRRKGCKGATATGGQDVPCPTHGLEEMMRGELMRRGVGVLRLFDAMGVEEGEGVEVA